MKKGIITLLLACTTLFLVAQSVTQAEYFIDKDKGIGKNTKLNVSLDSDSSFTFHINLTNITPGLHRLYIRTKASNNKWSLTAREIIEVFPSNNYPDVVKGEYFFDVDPGTGKAQAFDINIPDTAVTQTFKAPDAGLSPGYHKLYVRTRDNDGGWSLGVRRNVEFLKSEDTAKITTAEYFFSSDPGLGQAIAKAFATPLSDGIFKFTIPYNSIPAGADTVFIRLKDTRIEWSLTKLAPFSGAPFLRSGNNKLLIADANKNSLFQFNVVVSPNPVKDNILTLNIQHTKSSTLQLVVYSLDGKRVLSQQFEATGDISKQVNIGTLATGTYMLHLSDGIKVSTVPFIKE